MSEQKIDLVPVITLIARTDEGGQQTLSFYRCSGKTDDAGTLIVFEVEEVRGLEGEITGWRTKAKGEMNFFARGKWRRLRSEWIEEAREGEEGVH